MIKLNLNVVKNKKAAMFGLDARIALAIFGALSVISGAALYSAIQQAKVVQWQTYFSELAKASEAYYLDTGRQIPLTSNTSFDTEQLRLSINDLVINEDNVAGWQGPYWQATQYYTGTNDYYIRDNMTSSISSNAYLILLLRKESSWGASMSSSPGINELCSVNDIDCSEWFIVYPDSNGVDNLLKLFNLLDEKVDNGDGALSGSIRYSTNGNGWLFAKGRPRVYK